MTRQRLRESSVRWNMTLSLDSFALKVLKTAEEVSFSHKAKVTNINVPSKVKTYIEENLSKVLNYLNKKYKLQFNIIADNNLIIPEYKMDLLNKNKKIIKKIENIEKVYSRKNQIKKNFSNKKFNKNFRMRDKFKRKFKHHSKMRRNNFENKKLANY